MGTKSKEIIKSIVKATESHGVTIGICPKCGNRSLLVSDTAVHCLHCEYTSSHEGVLLLTKGIYPTGIKFHTSPPAEKNMLLNLYMDAEMCFRKALIKNSQALEYAHERGLSDDIISLFGIGYGEPLYGKMVKKYPKEILDSCGMFYQDNNGRYKDRFYNRLIIPIRDIHGAVIGFGGRILEDKKHSPKYINSPESLVFDKGCNLFAMNIAKNYAASYGLILCEGYMDAIALHKSGFPNAVASLGTALTQQQAALMRLHTQTVYISYDMDDAGKKAAVRAIEILKDAGFNDIRIINTKPYKYPDEIIQKEGMEGYRSRIKTSIPSWRYMLNIITDLMRRKQISVPEGYAQIGEEISGFSSDMVMKICAFYHLDPTYLNYKRILSC